MSNDATRLAERMHGGGLIYPLVESPIRQCDRSFPHISHDWQRPVSEWFKCVGVPAHRADGLTDDEGVVADALIVAVNAFGALPRQHPQEVGEFVSTIHVLQGLLATRIARRCYPAGWPVKSEQRSENRG